jgi:proteasome activator subunit 4
MDPIVHWFWPSPLQPHPQPDNRLSCLGLPLSLPYEVETLEEMDDRLDLIACRLVECVKAKEWGLGFRMWDSALTMYVISASLPGNAAADTL